MKLLFIVTGIGYGDATREYSIIKAILKRKPKTEIMIAGYDNSYNYFKGKFPVISIKGYKLPGKAMKFRTFLFLIKNYLLPLKWVLSTFKLKKELGDFKPDVIVSDFEPVGILLGRFIDKPCVTIFGYNPDDFSKIKNPSKKMKMQNKYLSGLYKMANNMIIPSLMRTYRTKYKSVNPVLIKRPEEFKTSEKELLKKLGLKKEPILIIPGGSNFGKILVEKLINIAELYDEDFIIIGSNFDIENRKNVRNLRFRENFLEYLKASKGIITLAGQETLSEAIAYKKPALVFPIQDHVEQTLNAERVKKFYMVQNDFNDLRFTLERFLNNLDKIKKDVPKINTNGADQIARIILKGDLK